MSDLLLYFYHNRHRGTPVTRFVVHLVHDDGRVTRRKLQTPGAAKEHNKTKTPTINPNDRQIAQLTDQAPGTIERAAHGSSRTSPTSTTLRATSTAAPGQHHRDPAGSSAESS